MKTLGTLNVRRFLTWTVMAAALITLVVAFQQQYRAGIKQQFNDFDRWMTMAPAFVHGQTSYVNDDLPTPPITLLVLGPMSALTRPAAQFVWVLLKFPLALLVFLLATAIVARSGRSLDATALALILAGWWLPVVVDMQEGQMNFLALLPLVAGLYVVQRETLAADVSAGLLIGLGAAVKVTPVVFLAYFLWKRRWRVAVSGLASVAICLLVLPALFFGWHQNLRWLGDWAQVMIVPYAARGHIVYSSTQSVGSFAVRLLSAAPAFEVHRDGVFEYGYMNLMTLSSDAVRLVVRVLMLAVVAAGLVWMRRPLSTLRSPRYVLEIGVVAAFMLWFSERTWVHHYVSFVLTLSAAGMLLSDPSVPAPRRALVKGILTLFAVATLFTSEAGRLLGLHGVEWAKAVGVFLWPSVLVTIAALRAALPRPREQPVTYPLNAPLAEGERIRRVASYVGVAALLACLAGLGFG
jgi:alpha-1,2-mannosyltransferase